MNEEEEKQICELWTFIFYLDSVDSKWALSSWEMTVAGTCVFRVGIKSMPDKSGWMIK